MTEPHKINVGAIPTESPYFPPHQHLHQMSHTSLGFELLVQNLTPSTTYSSSYYSHSTGSGLPQSENKYPETPPTTENHSKMPSRFSAYGFSAVKISHDLRGLSNKYKNIRLMFVSETTYGGGALNQSNGSSYNYSSKWRDPYYVRLPCDPENTTNPMHPSTGRQSVTVKRWDVIKQELQSLSNLINSKSLDLSQTGNQIHAYVLKYNFRAVDGTFNLLNHPKITPMLQTVFSDIVRAALEIEQQFPFGVPALRKHDAQTIFFTQRQIRCILANAFLCTFPKRMEIPNQEFTEINFMKLFDGGARGDSKPKLEKILCILHYFNRVKNLNSDGNLLSFERRQLHRDNQPDWKHSKERMSRIETLYQGLIEEAKDNLQVDFANRFVGGGVISNGAVMEEIRFSICPELIAARLFTEALSPTEVLIVTGCEQFSKYSGYADTFQFKGDYVDAQEIDNYGRRRTQVAVMDAAYFKANEVQRQFEKSSVDRDLNKCFCAFRPRRQQKIVTPIASGMWGCGAFHGDPELKFIIQWMAASQAGQRSLHYYTVGDKDQTEKIMHLVKFLGRTGVNVGTLYRAIESYYINEIDSKSFFKKNPKTLFQYFEKNQKW